MSEGTIAWLLVCSALVLFMTPGLALFYGGMVRSKNVLSMLMKNFFTISIVTVTWTLVGYTLAFGTGGGGIIGGLDFVGLSGLDTDGLLFMTFQMMFAIITPALITGAVRRADEVLRLGGVHRPLVAAGVPGGGSLGVCRRRVAVRTSEPVDFAGGLVVHINAGIAALALVFVLGPRRGFGTEAIRPHSLPLTLLGTGILWFGWFGFNAGSALAADGIAVGAFVTTQIAAAVAALGWVVAEWLRNGKPTTLGRLHRAPWPAWWRSHRAPGSSRRSPPWPSGCWPGRICFWAVSLKFRFGYDDSLDVVGVHLVGGIVGSLLLGVFASTAVNPAGPDGLLFGDPGFLAIQALAVVAVMAYSFVMSYILARIIKAVMGLRVDDQAEVEGLDISLHEERGYALTD